MEISHPFFSEKAFENFKEKRGDVGGGRKERSRVERERKVVGL